MTRALLLAVLAVLSTAASRAPTIQARGAAIAVERCGRCHAIGVAGESPNPKSPPFRTLGGLYPVADLLDALSQGAMPSHTGMPRFKLPREDTQALTQYVLSLQAGAADARR